MKNRLLRFLCTLCIITSYSTTIFSASTPIDEYNDDYKRFTYNLKNKNGYSSLMHAAGKDKISEIRKLIKAKADVNHQSANGFTPLICAAQSGNIDNVKKLLKDNADPNLSDNLSNTPLMHAALHNQLPICKLLIESKANMALRNKHEDTALDLARQSNQNSQIVHYLSNPHKKSDAYSKGDNKRALTYAQKNNTKELIPLIDQKTIDVNTEDADKTTLLLFAASNNNHIITKKLLEAQADPNHQDFIGTTALMEAAYRNHTDIVKLLLTNNANPNIIKNDGFTALLIAACEGHIETIETFLDHGSNINNQENPFKLSMLMSAAEHGHLALVKYLINHNADTSLCDRKKNNAFMIAIGSNHLAIAQEIFNAEIKKNKPFDIFMTNNNGDNALTLAIQNKHTKMVAFLLDTIKKSDEDPCNDYINLNIKTALTKAVANNYVDATRMLLAKNSIDQKEAQLLYSHTIKNNFTQIAQLLKPHVLHEPEVPAHDDQTVICSGPGCDKAGPLKCGQCKAVSYCSKECQTTHWKTGGHKAECAALKEELVLEARLQANQEQSALLADCIQRKPVMPEKKDDSDSSYLAQLSAAQEQLQAQKIAEKTAKSKTLVAALKDFNPDDKKTYLSLRWLIEQGYRLYGEDRKKYHQEYVQAEEQLFNKKHKARNSGSAAAEKSGPKKKQTAGRATQSSDKRDAPHRAEKDNKLQQLRHGVQPPCRGELPPETTSQERYYWPQKTADIHQICLSSTFSNAEQAAGNNAEQEAAAEEQSPYLTIPYGKETLQLNIKHLFDGEAGNKGLHHDHNRQLEQSNAFAYTHPQTNRFESEDNGCYSLEITKDGETKTKSFFPSQWRPQFLRSQLIKALQNNIYYVKGLDGKTLLGVIEASDPGEQFFNPIYFIAIIEEGGIITTIYPIAHAKYKKIHAEQKTLKPEDQKESPASAEQLAQQATEDDMLECAIALSLDKKQNRRKKEKNK